MTKVVMPEHISFDYWVARMVSAFSDDNLPLFAEESAWQEWAAFVVGQPSFIESKAPSPYGFSTWQEWARRLSEFL